MWYATTDSQTLATVATPKPGAKAPVTHHRSTGGFCSAGIGDPKRPAGWWTRGCHIVSEKWVKHYTVSFEYSGPSPSLKGIP